MRKVWRDMMKQTQKTVLAFDTAMSGLSVGVIASNGYVVSRQVDTQREQASLLIPTIQEVLEEAQIGFQDIDLLTCGKGPGSFTGLRIGLTTAKVMAQSLAVPLVGLSNLEVMAHHYQTQRPLLVVLETKRQDFYAQYFSEDFDTVRTDLCDPFSGDAQAVLACAPCDKFDIGGDCLTRFQGNMSADLSLLDEWGQPDPILMGQIALKRYESGVVSYDKRIEPLYLRGADISKPKTTQRKLAQQ
jgi:tRNA threonylcarbamoyl adenosine modification protein YeaZ